MILTLQEVKDFLKVDYNDEDLLLNDLIIASESYLYNATGKYYINTNQLAKLYCKVLINDWFKDRTLTVNSTKNLSVSEKVRYSLKSILMQLKYCEDEMTP